MSPEQQQIIKATLKGLRSTDAETVHVIVGQIQKVIPHEVCIQHGLFKYEVDVEETVVKRSHKSNSVIPEEDLTDTVCYGQVNRIKLLELLEQYERALA